MQAPLIDTRDYQALIAETEALARKFSGWQPRSDGQPDAGQALIRIFGRFAEWVVERINRAPEKNYLAFLNLIGTQMLPPQPARVPLTFDLATNSPVGAVVPAGAQVAAPPLEGEEDEVLFETERDLIVTRVQLQAVYVGDPETDSYSDRTRQATGQIDEPFDVFNGDRPTPHHLYLACDQLLTQPGTKNVTLVMNSPDKVQWTNWPISWAYWDGATWIAIDSSAKVENGAWRVTLAELPQLPKHPVNGIEAGWLRAQLDMPLSPGESGLAPESVAVGVRKPEDLHLPLYPFGATRAEEIEFFYLSADEAIAPGRALVRLQVSLAQKGAGANVKLNWTYKVGNEWKPLGQSSSSAAQVGASDFDFRDGTLAFTQNGEISFHVPATWPREFFYTRLGRWLRVEITDDSGPYTKLPQIDSLTVSYDWELPRIGRITAQLNQPPEALPPETAFFNNSALDLGKDFYPFGEQPRFNDTFYVACADALARPGAVVKLKVTLTNPPGSIDPPAVLTTGNPKIAWEVWDGRAWYEVKRSIYKDKDGNVIDTIGTLTASGDVTLTLPDPIAPTLVNGEEKHWLRARLVGGHYGEAATYKPGTDKAGNTIYEPVAATFAPPVIKSLTLEAVGVEKTEVPVSACLSYNDFTYVNRTASAAQGESFTPFAPTADPDPALYLGFDRPFDNRPATLYLQVEPPLPEEVAAGQLAELDPTTLAQVTWEYSGPSGWRPLGALDETQTLASRGLVQFVGPKDFAERSCFDRTLSWLRARWHRGYFPHTPRLRRVLLNTTWAAQVTAVENEILGSSNGNPDQTFVTAQTPVQPGQQVVVREHEKPAPAEQQALTALEGADAINVTLDTAGQPDEIRVRWHAVPDFYHSGPRDRHYTVDPLTGEIRFGDGQAGLIPSQGQNNVRITYRTGGGAQGNRAAQTIVQLKSAIPYIDGVTNHEPAQGGAPREPVERLKARGPRALRHRDRATTAQDLEDLAYAASTDVARVAAVAPTLFDPDNLWLDPTASPTEDHANADAGRMGVIVVPNADVTRPAPSLGLLRQVQAHLQARCPPTADLWVAGPEWVRVTVMATVVPTSLETADAVGGRVRTALERFLHPLSGGPHGQGWAFGRKPHRSDLFAVVEAVEGVDHVRTLDVTLEPESEALADRLKSVLNQSLAEASQQPPAHDLQRWLARALVYSGQHEITVVLETA